jgi:hypothetical protein
MEPSASAEVLGKCCREKYWKELADEEKIERLHQVVRILKSTVDRLNEDNDLFRQHQHDCDDNLMIPFDARYRMPGGHGYDNEYF